MNRRPPRSPDDRLDAEECALAAMLPRPHGRAEPGPELDARILAAARAATRPAGAAPPRRRSWIAPTALAASLMLAVGLAWQLRPPESLRSQAPVAEAAPAEADAMAVRMIEAPSAAASGESPAPPPMAATPPPAEPAVAGKVASAPPAAAAKPEAAPAPMRAPVPPPPPPAPAAPVADEFFAAPAASAEQAAAPARAPAPALAKSARTSDPVRERASTAAGNATKPPVRDEARQAADAATLDTVTVLESESGSKPESESEQPEQEVPPATADSPEVREAWLRRIGELLKQGKAKEAKASLDEFRRRYPEAAIPPELRKLQP